MFKRSWGTGIALGLVAGVAIACAIFFVSLPEFRDPSYQPSTQQSEFAEASDQENEESQQIVGWWPWLSSFVDPEDTLAQWIMAAFAALATGISVLAVVLLDRTLKATRDAIRASEENSNKTIRPWILADGAEFQETENTIVDGIRHDRVLGFNLKWKNFGQTPGIESDVLIRFVLVPFGADLPEFESVQHLGTNSVAPNFPIGGVRKGIFGDDLERFKRRESQIILYGRADYREPSGSKPSRFSEVVYRCTYVDENVDRYGNRSVTVYMALEGAQNRVT